MNGTYAVAGIARFENPTEHGYLQNHTVEHAGSLVRFENDGVSGPEVAARPDHHHLSRFYGGRHRRPDETHPYTTRPGGQPP